MENIEEQQTKRRLIVRFHALLRAAGMKEEDKRDILEGVGVESTKELTVEQLKAVCDFLETLTGLEEQGKEMMRRRALRAVCKLCEVLMDEWETWDGERRLRYAKSIVCRAAGSKSLNKIGADRLRSIAYSFEKQRKDMESALAEAEKIVKGE